MDQHRLSHRGGGPARLRRPPGRPVRPPAAVRPRHPGLRRRFGGHRPGARGRLGDRPARRPRGVRRAAATGHPRDAAGRLSAGPDRHAHRAAHQRHRTGGRGRPAGRRGADGPVGLALRLLPHRGAGAADRCPGARTPSRPGRPGAEAGARPRARSARRPPPRAGSGVPGVHARRAAGDRLDGGDRGRVPRHGGGRRRVCLAGAAHPASPAAAGPAAVGGRRPGARHPGGGVGRGVRGPVPRHVLPAGRARAGPAAERAAGAAAARDDGAGRARLCRTAAPVRAPPDGHGGDGAARPRRPAVLPARRGFHGRGDRRLLPCDRRRVRRGDGHRDGRGRAPCAGGPRRGGRRASADRPERRPGAGRRDGDHADGPHHDGHHTRGPGGRRRGRGAARRRASRLRRRCRPPGPHRPREASARRPRGRAGRRRGGRP